MKNAIIKKFIKYVTSKELYVWDDFFTEQEVYEEYPEVIEINPPQWGADGGSIRIDEIKKMIKDFEDAGCSHVGIDWNPDHLEYDIYGYEIRKATEKEMKDETKKEEERIKKNKERRIQDLKEMIKELENEV